VLVQFAALNPDLPMLKCPSLVITAEESNLGDIKTMETWRVLIQIRSSMQPKRNCATFAIRSNTWRPPLKR
jgi:hypothetical protein